jgi:hypothetical protein
MELKSPLTVRQNSVVPFEHAQNNMIAQNGDQMLPLDSQQQLQQQQQQISYNTNPVQQRNFIDNPYNNRGVLRTTNYTSLQPPQPVLALQQAQQTVPVTRNVYLNR